MLFSQDLPDGNYRELMASNMKKKDQSANAWKAALLNYRSWIMCLSLSRRAPAKQSRRYPSRAGLQKLPTAHSSGCKDDEAHQGPDMAVSAAVPGGHVCVYGWPRSHPEQLPRTRQLARPGRWHQLTRRCVCCINAAPPLLHLRL